MARMISFGGQNFSKLIENGCFYVDKTMFIKKWWPVDDVTLITRPRRFGKTLALSMVERFFSVQYQNQPDIFRKLAIYKDNDMMKLQGTYPVISLSMIDITMPTYEEMINSISSMVRNLFSHVKYGLGYDGMDPDDIEYMETMRKKRYDANGRLLPIPEWMIKESVPQLSDILERKCKNKVIILLDEYDAPLEKAYLCGYWDKAAEFFGQFYRAMFKSNKHLEKGLITGISVIPKESLNSPFNTAKPCSVTAPYYEEFFGFTQKEVDAALEEYSMLDKREEVRYWYDGYQFGKKDSMYNPMSITSMLDRKEFRSYWANSASNDIVSHVIKHGSNVLKEQFMVLMQGGSIIGEVNETITYKTLRTSDQTVWGLLLSCGYLKALEMSGKEYSLAIVNHEVREMMDDLVKGWFTTEYDDATYGDFIEALLKCDEKKMQSRLATMSRDLMGSFDIANKEGEKNPENFYHGFALGLVASLRKRFYIGSNRESGDGRYDIMLEPKDKEMDYGILIEFKVFNPEKEKSLDETCARALKQINDKHYDAELKKHGVPDNRIVKFGIGYKGKEVSIRKQTA